MIFINTFYIHISNIFKNNYKSEIVHRKKSIIIRTNTNGRQHIHRFSTNNLSPKSNFRDFEVHCQLEMPFFFVNEDDKDLTAMQLV